MPVLDAAGTVGESLAGITTQTEPSVDEIVVAHGPSTDRTAEVLERLARDDARIRVVDNPTGGRSSGLNRAIEASSGDVVVRCDSHAVLPPGYVGTMLDLLETTGADVVGGVQHGVGTTPVGRAVALAQSMRLGAGGSQYRTGGRGGEVDTVYLGVYRRSALERVGGFDEDLEGNEDYELNWRIRRSGGRIVLDTGVRIAYVPRGRLRDLWRQYFRYGAWKRVMLRRHPRSIRLRQVVAPLLVLGLIASAALAATPLWGWAIPLPALYLGTLGAAAIWSWIATRDPAGLLVAPALATMHVGWGVGFLVGSPLSRAGRRRITVASEDRGMSQSGHPPHGGPSDPPAG
jgi:glycosyltransferase involved in cell wall biosynthesis